MAAETINDQVLAILDRLDRPTLGRVARLFLENVRYLDQHAPEKREAVAPFACSGQAYHYCSFSTPHDPGCPAVGGDGKLKRSGGKPCPPDCGETEAEPWCNANGFDCPDCELVDALHAVVSSVMVEQIATYIRACRFTYHDEARLQEGIAAMLADIGLSVEQEVRLDSRCRIDLAVDRVGIEVKVAGRAAEVRRQISRYLASDRLDALVLVTNRVRHLSVPDRIHGKPVRVVTLVEAGL